MSEDENNAAHVDRIIVDLGPIDSTFESSLNPQFEKLNFSYEKIHICDDKFYVIATKTVAAVAEGAKEKLAFISNSAEIEANNVICTLVNREDNVVGGIFYSYVQQFCEIYGLAVQANLPAGAGTLLLNVALQHLRSVGVENVMLETNSAANFYKKNGFEVLHTLSKVWMKNFHGESQDNVVMTKILQPGIKSSPKAELETGPKQ